MFLLFYLWIFFAVIWIWLEIKGSIWIKKFYVCSFVVYFYGFINVFFCVCVSERPYILLLNEITRLAIGLSYHCRPDINLVMGPIRLSFNTIVKARWISACQLLSLTDTPLLPLLLLASHASLAHSHSPPNTQQVDEDILPVQTQFIDRPICQVGAATGIIAEGVVFCSTRPGLAKLIKRDEKGLAGKGRSGGVVT